MSARTCAFTSHQHTFSYATPTSPSRKFECFSTETFAYRRDNYRTDLEETSEIKRVTFSTLRFIGCSRLHDWSFQTKVSVQHLYLNLAFSWLAYTIRIHAVMHTNCEFLAHTLCGAVRACSKHSFPFNRSLPDIWRSAVNTWLVRTQHGVNIPKCSFRWIRGSRAEISSVQSTALSV